MAVLVIALVSFLCFGHGSLAESSASGAVPLSLSPSAYWDGNDGPWSSFLIQIGTPPQSVRLFPGTSATAGDTMMVVLPQGCTADDSTNCADDRGWTFAINGSTSWSTERLANGGLYELSLYEENFLGYSGNAYYGFDNVTLGAKGAGLPTLSHQLVAGIATKDFYLGSLGLSPIPFNFTDFNTPLPSMLGTLRNENKIPSLSWGYTAGASYTEPQVLGSSTLGGYDASRFVPNNVSISFGADQSRDLLVGIQSITYDTIGSTPLLTTGIYAFINSLVPQIWLPTEVCQAFERAFNLTWNETAELYLLDDHTHNTLVAQNPTITFKVGQLSTGGESVDIVMPYKAFDLTVSPPLFHNTTRYFPLKRAQNSTQYTLGRTFLQQAYVIADYERRNFSVSQALFPATSVAQQLVPILPRGAAANGTSVNGTTVPASGAAARTGLSTGGIVGTVVGVVLVLAAIFAAIFFYRRHVRKRRTAAHAGQEAGEYPHTSYSKPELDATGSSKVELDATDNSKAELDASLKKSAPELDGTGTPAELAGQSYPFGKKGLAHSTEVHELPAGDAISPEVETSRPFSYIETPVETRRKPHPTTKKAPF